jgi:uncharacterized glyoxalase superfamily protein PhnB
MNENTNPVSAPAPTVWAGVSYADAPAAIRFLDKAFGFVEVLNMPGEGDGVIDHAQLNWPEGGGVMLSTYDEGSEVNYSPPGAGSVYVVTDSPDALFERATAAGAKVIRGLRDEDYGSRGFTVADLEGNQWSFGTYRGA